MKRSNTELNDILDRATAAIRRERVDQSVVEGAAERVRAKLSNQTATASAPAALAEPVGSNVDHIRNCDDFQRLIPEYMNGTLSPARSLLFEDHTHECIPCRKALKEARFGVAAPARPSASRISASQRTMVRWAIAATAVMRFTWLSTRWMGRLISSLTRPQNRSRSAKRSSWAIRFAHPKTRARLFSCRTVL